MISAKIKKADFATYSLQDSLHAEAVYYRDALSAKDLKSRMKPTHFIHNVSNLLLRSLSVVRGVSPVLAHYKY